MSLSSIHHMTSISKLFTKLISYRFDSTESGYNWWSIRDLFDSSIWLFYH